MVVKLYKNTAPIQKIDKSGSLKNETTYSCTFVEDGSLDLINPSLLLNISDEYEDIPVYNYCYIPKSDRYYFITRMAEENGLTRIDCHCDVLFSFKDDILSSSQYIERSESRYSKLIADEKLPLKSKPLYVIKQFGTPIYDEHCSSLVLETVGKGESGSD